MNANLIHRQHKRRRCRQLVAAVAAIVLEVSTLLPFATWELHGQMMMTAWGGTDSRSRSSQRQPLPMKYKQRYRTRSDRGNNNDDRSRRRHTRTEITTFSRRPVSADTKAATANATVVFLHIGKSGGTAFDKLMKNVLRGLERRYIGHQHFDWSYIQAQYPHADVVTILRDPGSRAVSHYYFSRGLLWTRGKAVRDMTLSEYLNGGREVMMETRGLWQDGQAGQVVDWYQNCQVRGTRYTNIDRAKRRTGAECNAHCLLAADRLNQTAWFGLLHRLDESMKMLVSYLRLPVGTNLTLPKANRKQYAPPTSTDKAILTSLMPMDLWLWQYANDLFDARWDQHNGRHFIDPPLPPLPNLTCFSTRDSLECDSGPLAETIPRLSSADSIYNRIKQR